MTTATPAPTTLTAKEYHLLRLADMRAIRRTEGGIDVVDPGHGRPLPGGLYGRGGALRTREAEAKGWIVLDTSESRWVLTELGQQLHDAEKADRDAAKTELQRALQTVTVRRAE
jgi:hypothetical protein